MTFGIAGHTDFGLFQVRLLQGPEGLGHEQPLLLAGQRQALRHLRERGRKPVSMSPCVVPLCLLNVSEELRGMALSTIVSFQGRRRWQRCEEQCQWLGCCGQWHPKRLDAPSKNQP